MTLSRYWRADDAVSGRVVLSRHPGLSWLPGRHQGLLFSASECFTRRGSLAPMPHCISSRAGHSCSFLCSRLRRQIQNLVSFSQVIQARHIVISDHKPICQNVKSQVKSKPSSYLFSLCKTLSDLADSFRHIFNLHVTTQGRLRSLYAL